MKLKFSGDQPNPNDRYIMIANHRTQLDWLYLWSFFARFGRLRNEKIVLKFPLKFVPGAGWAMQMFSFMFLKRKWEEDKVHMSNQFGYYKSIGYRLQMLIFPEGTDFNKKSLGRSDAFAEKMNLPKYKYVLHPRTTGFVHCVRELKDDIDFIYDVSLGYPKNIPLKPTSIAKGDIPKEVHINVKKYDIKILKSMSDEEIQKWCEELWKEKEKKLEKFYDDKSFKSFDREMGGPGYDSLNSMTTKIMAMALLYWAFFCVGAVYLVATQAVVFYYCLLATAVFVGISIKYKGVEMLELRLYGPNIKVKKQ
eukprot:Nk52_evm86s221 gene=Nk52_evmTU86s221